jgi:hypothetical protein
MPIITINPIDNGTIIISAADATTGVTFSGTETDLDGQQIGVTIEKGYGNTRFIGTLNTVAVNGAWSITMPAGLATTLPDGIYSVTAFETASQSASNQPTETVIVAEHATPFEVVGLAFNDVNQQLVSEPFVLSIHQELVAEQSGLENLQASGALPAKPIEKLIGDVVLEQQLLNFTSQSAGFADSRTIAMIDEVQEKMAHVVEKSPALLAQMPDHLGWTKPIDTGHHG